MNDDAIPVPGRVDHLGPGLRRILAPNPSPMTYHGTNSYLLGSGAVALIDPGPEDPAHLAALRAALEPGERISHIFVTHSHLDHSPLARRLSAETGAPVLGFGPSTAGRSRIMAELAESGAIGGGEGVDTEFAPQIALKDGAVVEGDGWRVTALWTPGHMSNHLCFEAGDVIFSGDHVMGWASSLISPPDGDMTAYMASLDRLSARGARRLLPGHGTPVEDPAARIAWLLSHRRDRAAAILSALGDTPRDIARLTAEVYSDLAPSLRPAAERNVLAHLIDFLSQNLVSCDLPLSPETRFTRRPSSPHNFRDLPLDAP